MQDISSRAKPKKPSRATPQHVDLQSLVFTVDSTPQHVDLQSLVIVVDSTPQNVDLQSLVFAVDY